MIVLSAEFVKSATEPGGYPPAGPPEFAFCGRSNVGKSSALNALAGRRRLARISRTPGRTRLINFFDLRVRTEDGGPERDVRFADLPGYGFASGPREERERWKEMIERYLTLREPLRALVVVVDGEIGPQQSDLEMVRWAHSLQRKVVAVATKLDKLSRPRRGAQVEKIAARLQTPIIPFSAREHFGVEELWRELLSGR